jgi:hypothetical protein
MTKGYLKCSDTLNVLAIIHGVSENDVQAKALELEHLSSGDLIVSYGVELDVYDRIVNKIYYTREYYARQINERLRNK